MEHRGIKELCQGCDQREIWNMDESGYYFKALPAKGLSQKGKKAKSGKKSKQRITVAFFIITDKEKDSKPIVIWRSKKPSSFRLASAPDKLVEVSYFYDTKSWIQVEIMEKVLDTLNFQVHKGEKKCYLILG